MRLNRKFKSMKHNIHRTVKYNVRRLRIRRRHKKRNNVRHNNNRSPHLEMRLLFRNRSIIDRLSAMNTAVDYFYKTRRSNILFLLPRCAY